ncbi:MAG TPA: VCBS repeat-containing protein [Planctomycetota bacterium]|nr:VCBS repeat-containing protein [Planctomycetota bacterium]
MRTFAAVLLLAAAAAPLFAGPSGAEREEYVLRTWKKIRVTDKFYAEGANVGDFNRDGKMDIVAGPYWIEGPDFTKTHLFMAEEKAYDPAAYSKNFFAYTWDVNKDGWTDIIIYGFPGEDVSWYENPQGKEGPWIRHKVIDKLDNESPQFVDVNGDGIPDVVGSTDGKLGYWTISDWKFHPISPKGGYQRFTHGLGVGDVNGDGRMDILEANGWWEQPKSLEGDPEWTLHKEKFGKGGAQMYAYDVNGDGLPDVITSIEAHGLGLSWFEQLKEGGFKEHVILGRKDEDNKYGVRFSQMHAIDLVDMDGDGLKDIVTGKRYWAHGAHGDVDPGAPAVLYWFKLVRGKDGSVDWIPFKIDDDSGVGTQVIAADLNGDKYPDVVVSNKKGIFVHIGEVKKVSREEYEKQLPKPADGR